MGKQESEDNKFRLLGHLVERPMDSADATGAPSPGKRYNRELVYRAWIYLADHNPNDRLPDWVAEYLQKVAKGIVDNLGPRGGLSPASAHVAIDLVGQQWPEHHPEKVFMIMQRWIDGGADQPPITRKAAAVRYIKEHMNNDENVKWKHVVHRFKEGKKAANNHNR